MSTEQSIVEEAFDYVESEIPITQINNRGIKMSDKKNSTDKARPISHKRGKIQATIEKKQEQAQRAKENKEASKSKIKSTNTLFDKKKNTVQNKPVPKSENKSSTKNDKFNQIQIDEDLLSAYR